MPPSPRPALAEPLRLPCGAVLANRIVKAAMGEGLAGGDRLPNERHIRLYSRWAKGGAGTLITGNIMVDPLHCSPAGNVAVGESTPLAPFAAWAEAVTTGGCALWAQLNHPGRQIAAKYDPEPVAPSAVPLKKSLLRAAIPRPMTAGEIAATVTAFGRAAGHCQRAGFSGVQIHAAHGYLISQFLAPATNRRTDQWGGTAAGRRRFLLAVVEAVRGAVGAGFPVAVKVNSADFQRGGVEEHEALETVRVLAAASIDVLEISGGTYENPVTLSGTGSAGGKLRGAERSAPRGRTAEREAYFLAFATKAREICPRPIMLTGGFRTLSAMSRAVADGSVDLVGLARPLARNPDLPRSLLAGHDARSHDLRRVGHKRIDALVDLRWHVAQLHRMAVGLDPDPALGRRAALMQAIWRLYGPA